MTADRAAYTAGLRALADALDNDLNLPLPYHSVSVAALVFVQTKAELVAYARLMGKADKRVTDSDAYGFELTGRLHGLSLSVMAPREEVCERVVTGTREITREIPDPKALAAVPTVTVTETVEDVTWQCRPLLADPAPGATSDADRQAAVICQTPTCSGGDNPCGACCRCMGPCQLLNEQPGTDGAPS